MYLGLQLGGGYVLSLSEKNALDLYGRYFWTRLGSENVTLTTGENVKFNSLNSHRIRVGGRYVHSVSSTQSFYAGLAFEHEFDAKAKATMDVNSIDAIGLKGSRGIGEIGMRFTPSEKRPLFVDVGIQGYVGKRQGVAGNVRLNHAF
jgi:hypothetical protein